MQISNGKLSACKVTFEDSKKQENRHRLLELGRNHQRQFDSMRKGNLVVKRDARGKELIKKE